MNPPQLTRRRFHERLAAGTTAGLLSLDFATRATSAAAGEPKFPPGRYVDVHTHLGTVWNSGTELTAEALLRWMDSADIAQAVVLPLVSPESSSYPISTDYVLAQTGSASRPLDPVLLSRSAHQLHWRARRPRKDAQAIRRRRSTRIWRAQAWRGDRRPSQHGPLRRVCRAEIARALSSRQPTQHGRPGTAGPGARARRVSEAGDDWARARLVGVDRRRHHGRGPGRLSARRGCARRGDRPADG